MYFGTRPFLYVQQYFQMTITKVLQICYLTNTDKKKLADRWKIIRKYVFGLVDDGSYQLLVIRIKTIKNTENVANFFNTSVVAQEKPLVIDFRKSGSWDVLPRFGSYHKISITDTFFKIR